MTLPLWLSLVAVCVLGALSPGPSLAVVLRYSISHSTKHGIVVALSHGFGVGVYALLSVLGLSTLVIGSPMIYQGLVYGGAIYLFYMGFKALTANGGSFKVERTQEHESVSLFVAARDGFAIAFLNPKLLVFFVALFSQFIDENSRSLVTGSIMVGTVLIIDTLWYVIVAALVHKTRERFALADKSALIDKIAGLVFIGLSIRVLTL